MSITSTIFYYIYKDDITAMKYLMTNLAKFEVMQITYHARIQERYSVMVQLIIVLR